MKLYQYECCFYCDTFYNFHENIRIRANLHMEEYAKKRGIKYYYDGKHLCMPTRTIEGTNYGKI